MSVKDNRRKALPDMKIRKARKWVYALYMGREAWSPTGQVRKGNGKCRRRSRFRGSSSKLQRTTTSPFPVGADVSILRCTLRSKAWSRVRSSRVTEPSQRLSTTPSRRSARCILTASMPVVGAVPLSSASPSPSTSTARPGLTSRPRPIDAMFSAFILLLSVHSGPAESKGTEQWQQSGFTRSTVGRSTATALLVVQYWKLYRNP